MHPGAPDSVMDERHGVAATPRSRSVPFVMAALVVGLLAAGGLLVWRAGAQVNEVALAAAPKGVTVVEARPAQYRASRKYVGTIEPWIETKIGPQLTSAYVDTVLVRPGDVVARGQIIATLDCRNASAQSKAIGGQARALQAQQEALAHEAARISELEHGGFASPNEIENKRAQSSSKQAELEATQARMLRASLEVNDCVLRSPFAGEVSQRLRDPGAFVHPGDAIAVLVDRSTVRVTTDVPEMDFGVVPPKTPVRMRAFATGKELTGTIARRSPAADDATRTVHVEIDVPDPDRSLPVGTTADLVIDVGEPVVATEVPLSAASIRGDKASLFVIEGTMARKRVLPVLGEQGGSLFLDKSLVMGSHVVTEGRSQLKDGDSVRAKLDGPTASKIAEHAP